MSAARVLARWAVRVVRREWRQLIRVIALTTVAVAVGVVAVVTTFNLVDPPTADYGTASVRASVAGPADAIADRLREAFGPVGVIQSASIDADGSVRPIAVRVQDRSDSVAAPLLALVEGSHPARPGQVALTDGVAQQLEATVGSEAELADRRYRVVGLVENPTDLADEFVLASSLDDVGVDRDVSVTTFLVDASEAEIASVVSEPLATESNGVGVPSVRTIATVAMSIVVAVAMLQVALLSAAGFAVFAQRRSRQLGLLAAAGASPHRLRIASAAIGASAGSIGAVGGTVIGLVATTPVIPRLEETVGHRIDLTVPWWAVGAAAGGGFAAAVVASWWPARALASRPVIELLDGRRRGTTTDRPSRRLSVAATATWSIGLLSLVVGSLSGSTALSLLGVIGVSMGVLLICPLVTRWIGRIPASTLWLRLAWRSIARSSGRSAAFLAALAVALGVPTAVASAASAIDAGSASGPRNLPANVALVTADESTDGAGLLPLDGEARLERIEDDLARAVSGHSVIPIDVAVDDGVVYPGSFVISGQAPGFAPEVTLRPLDRPCSDCNVFQFRVDGSDDPTRYEGLATWVATSTLLDALDVPPGLADRPDVVLTAGSDDIVRVDHPAVGGGRRLVALDPGSLPQATSLAPTLLPSAAAEALGLTRTTIGWLVVADRPLTDADRSAIDDAVDDRALVEVTEEPRPSVGLQSTAMAISIVFALGAAWMMIGLLRLETEPDQQLLAVLGAPPSIGRGVLPVMVGSLALVAGLLALPIGAATQAALVADRSTSFRFSLPVPVIATTVVIIPVLAAVAASIRSKVGTARGNAA